MRVALALAVVFSPASVLAASPCEIRGLAIHWAYDACMARHETDDALHAGVTACADRAQLLIEKHGECKAKRIFKDRICALTRQSAGDSGTQQSCMTDPGVAGSVVRNGGI